jgi:Cu-processing system permease protein
MSSTLRVLHYGLRDVLRRRWVVGYALFFAAMTEGLLWLGGGGARLVVSLMDVVLLIIPLVSISFSALYVYNAQGFLELLLSQPISRRELFTGLWGALALPLSLAFILGVGVPLALAGGQATTTTTLIATGVALTIVFVTLGLYVAALVPDRIKGMGVALAVWLICAVAYDGLVLMLTTVLGAHAAAGSVLGALIVNPVDVARLLLLVQLDAPVLMGYTDAAARQLLAGHAAIVVAASALTLWWIVPTMLGLRAFERRDW